MPAKVADASVIAAMAFGEPRGEKAAELLEEADLYEPTLLAYELTSIARKKVLLYLEQSEAIALALEMVMGLDVQWVEADHVGVLRLALETGLTTYDATYLWVAQNLAVPLVTFDERLRRVAGAQSA